MSSPPTPNHIRLDRYRLLWEVMSFHASVFGTLLHQRPVFQMIWNPRQGRYRSIGVLAIFELDALGLFFHQPPRVISSFPISPFIRRRIFAPLLVIGFSKLWLFCTHLQTRTDNPSRTTADRLFYCATRLGQQKLFPEDRRRTILL